MEEKGSRDLRRWLDSAHLNFRAHATPSSNGTLHRHHQWTQWLITFRFTSSHQPLKAFFVFNYSKSWNALSGEHLADVKVQWGAIMGPTDVWSLLKVRRQHLLIRRRWKVGISSWDERKSGKCSPFFAAIVFMPAQSPETWFISRINYRLPESSILRAFSNGKTISSLTDDATSHRRGAFKLYKVTARGESEKRACNKVCKCFSTSQGFQGVCSHLLRSTSISREDKILTSNLSKGYSPGNYLFITRKCCWQQKTIWNEIVKRTHA